MMPTDIFKKYTPFKTRESIDAFFHAFAVHNFECNKYMLEKVLSVIKDEELLDYFYNAFEDHEQSGYGKKRYREDPPKLYRTDEVKIRWGELTQHEQDAIKQKKFERRIIFTPQGNKR